MNPAIRRASVLFLTGALALAGVGCADDDNAESADTVVPNVVNIVLDEWTVTPSASSVASGSVTLTAKNAGTKTHELVLFKTDLAPDSLPLDEEGAVDERGEGIELIDEVEDVEAGATKSFTADLTAGTYLLVCNLVDETDKHFEHKMYAPLRVT